MSNLYRLNSKFYDLLDVIYFKRFDMSPRTAIQELIPDNGKVLDICTGTATNGILIAENKINTFTYGIDISKEMLEIAKEKIKKQNLTNIKLKQMDATATDFDNESFDVVLISLVLHEISNDLATKIIEEAKRVVKAEGKIIVIEWEKPSSFFRKLVFLPIQWMEPKRFYEFLNCDMYEYFRKRQLEIVSLKHCDYSKVIELSKNRGKVE